MKTRTDLMENSDETVLDRRQLLDALQRVRQGDFTVRLPGSLIKIDGKIADTFNEIVAANQRIAQELKRVGQVVGKKDKTRERAKFDQPRGDWGDMESSVNTLIDELHIAERRKDEFLALLAHELRNPLAPLRNAISILQLKESRDPEVLWCRGVIERQAAQLTRLVDDLLDASRITLGKIKLRPQALDLAAVIARAVETSRPLIDGHRHELLVTVPDAPVRVEGDRARLTQVIANLLNNAAKYQNDCGTIALTLERQPPETVITVRDHGIGIAPEMLSEIFQLFSQGKRTLDRAQGGLGIGLSLVKTVVELHGGRVSASSEGPGCGSEFSIRLPCLLQELNGYHAGAEDDTAEVPDCAPLRILVVDDSRDAAESLTRLLRLGGHKVLMAREGEHALHLAATLQPAVVLLDIGLPGMDGYELCRRLRQGGLANALIVAMTGYGLERDRQRSQEAGFDTHLVKPVPPDQLLRMMAQHSLARRNSAGLPTDNRLRLPEAQSPQ